MEELYSPKDIVSSGLCIGCGSCVAQERVNGADTSVQFDSDGQLKPYGPVGWYRQPSDSFSRTCPFSPLAKNEDMLAADLFPAAAYHNAIGRYQTNLVGHVSEEDFRLQGSSGGMVTWVATELMRNGLIDGVAHVIATAEPQQEARFFKYRISRSEEEIREGAKSRYYPVELSGILETIGSTPGRYAIIAIPCMIKAVQLLRDRDPILRERICFTLGLFCGHMKSARFVESFAWQLQVPVNQVKQVEFRHKYPDRPANWYNAMLTTRDGQQVNKDWWHLVDGDWGAGFFMNSACNFCDDVVAETADISFGDAWVEPYSSDGMGTNVVVVRSPVINQLISAGRANGRLQLQPVNAEFVEQTQAAGLRQRREGLAYRLTWAPRGVQPVKRVAPDAERPARARKVIYRTRYYLSKWSHIMFRMARRLKIPRIYISWARAIASVYHGIAYHNGKLSEMRKRYAEFK